MLLVVEVTILVIALDTECVWFTLCIVPQRSNRIANRAKCPLWILWAQPAARLAWVGVSGLVCNQSGGRRGREKVDSKIAVAAFSVVLNIFTLFHGFPFLWVTGDLVASWCWLSYLMTKNLIFMGFGVSCCCFFANTQVEQVRSQTQFIFSSVKFHQFAQSNTMPLASHLSGILYAN